MVNDNDPTLYEGAWSQQGGVVGSELERLPSIWYDDLTWQDNKKWDESAVWGATEAD